MTPADPAALALIHAACFPDHPRPWSAVEITEMLKMRGSFLLHHPDAFLIGRVIADEAELLTLAVAPAARRQGLGRRLVGDFTATARDSGARQGFLEVASDNAPAQALYAAAGWRRAGLRRNYYAPGVDAIILSRALTNPVEIG